MMLPHVTRPRVDLFPSGHKSRIAFLKYGDFSHINDRVEAQLRANFPEFVIDTIDVKAVAIDNRVRAAMLLGRAFAEHGPKRLARWRDPFDMLVQSSGMFRYLRQRIQTITRKHQYFFTLQTQSMWDGATPGIPHFVYTDHCESANLTYPGFDRRRLLGDWWTKLERSIYEHATRIFTMSSHVTDCLIRDYGCAMDKVECVYAGSNSSITTPTNSRCKDTKIVLFVGVDWERKGGPDLLAAFERVRRNHPDAMLRIVGCNPPIRAPNCQVYGRVPLALMPQHFAEADVFCLPTRREPFGIAFVEAMHAKLPIVATDVGAIRDMVTDGENGFRVPVADVTALATAIIRVFDDADVSRRMGERSNTLAKERYTWDAVGRRLASAIRGRLSAIAPPSQLDAIGAQSTKAGIYRQI